MSDFNELFDSFPDYDVFDPNNKEIKSERLEKVYTDNDFIEYDAKRDFRNRKPVRPHPVPGEVIEEPEEEHSTDYRDDYGVYRIYEEKVKNYATIFFFPFSVLWLEFVLRLSCGQPLFTFGTAFVVLFSLSFSAVITTVCTLFGEKFNRFLAKIILLILTIWYCTQLVHFGLNNSFFMFSSHVPTEMTLEGFNTIMDMMSDKVYYLLACFVPFVFNLFLGKYFFPFRKIRVPAKICLLLVAVLLHFTAVTLISFDKSSQKSETNYSAYHQSADDKLLQENFGLYTMQRKDLLK